MPFHWFSIRIPKWKSTRCRCMQFDDLKWSKRCSTAKKSERSIYALEARITGNEIFRQSNPTGFSLLCNRYANRVIGRRY